MIAIANNEKLKLTQSIVVDLIENEKGFLSMAEKATITTQSMLPAQTKGASPGGGTCNKCGATFTDEQDFILHQENCEYTSVSAKLALKKPHGYVGHVTLLK